MNLFSFYEPGPKVTIAVVHGKVADGGRLIVPAAFRREMGVGPGDSVVMELHGDELRVRPAKSALKRLREKLSAASPGDVSVVDELIAERRRESADD
jgi:bifunctional DNA-binding transcriptional regulator/antitoxin component of YhaV-PrlF toxin-antitoxin module